MDVGQTSGSEGQRQQLVGAIRQLRPLQLRVEIIRCGIVLKIFLHPQTGVETRLFHLVLPFGTAGGDF